MKATPGPLRLSFQCKLERIATDMEYFAFTIPLQTSQALGTRKAVPVSVQMNDSAPFTVSLAPIGGGRHWLRVNAKARIAAKIKEGDLVHVQITVLDRSVSVPPDLARALRAEGAQMGFKAMSVGQQNFVIKQIGEAAKPETREKRIKAAVELARVRARRVRREEG